MTKKRKRKKLSKKCLKDMQNVFDKHGIDGESVGIMSSYAGTKQCPPGMKPYTYTYKDSQGNWITRTICVKI